MEIGKYKFENEKTAMQTDNFKLKEQPPTTCHPQPTEGRRRISTFRATTNYKPCAFAFDFQLSTVDSPLALTAQVAPRHIRRRRLAQNAKHRRRDVAQRTTRLKRSGSIIAHQNERHRIQRVICMRTACHGIDHRFGVAVVGGDDPGTALRLERVVDAA